MFIKEPGLKSISKEEFFKVDSLTIIPSTYKIYEYTLIISGAGKTPKYVIWKGSKLKPELKEWVKDCDSCVVSIDEIKVLDNEGNKLMLPSFGFSVK